MPVLVARGLKRVFGGRRAVDGVEVCVEAGEFFTIVGPSGCGKTTTLRILGGFEPLDEGQVVIDGQDVTGLPPNKRPVNTVFQHYALFPHMTVAQNVAYGLRARRTPKRETRDAVAGALRLVRLEGFEDRRPSRLSGGEQQRVALARALVCRPRVLLLDEPLGALDVALRRTMQDELKAIQREAGIAFVYVTHDQEEALGLSDRIAVMRAGRFEQSGRPQQVYDEPETAFVAGFLGIASLVQGTVASTDGEAAVVSLGDGSRCGAAAAVGRRVGDRVTVVVRPEAVRIDLVGAGREGVPSTIRSVVFEGSTVRVTMRGPSGSQLVARLPAADAGGFDVGQSVVATWAPREARIVDREIPRDVTGGAGGERRVEIRSS